MSFNFFKNFLIMKTENNGILIVVTIILLILGLHIIRGVKCNDLGGHYNAYIGCIKGDFFIY